MVSGMQSSNAFIKTNVSAYTKNDLAEQNQLLKERLQNYEKKIQDLEAENQDPKTQNQNLQACCNNTASPVQNALEELKDLIKNTNPMANNTDSTNKIKLTPTSKIEVSKFRFIQAKYQKSARRFACSILTALFNYEEIIDATITGKHFFYCT